MYQNSHFYKPSYLSYPYIPMQYMPYYNQYYFPLNNQIQQFRPAVFNQTQIPVQQQNYITISDDEESIPEQKIATPPPQPIQSIQTKKQMPKMLNLDQLEEQGKLYDYESSPPPQLPKRVIHKPQKLIQQKQKKRKNRIKRQPTKKTFRCIKQVQISNTRQQIQFPQSSVKVRLIKVYERNEDQFLKLYEHLKTYFPTANDEDVAVILNACDKSYSKAESLIQESGSFISYYLNSQKDQQIDENTQRK